jgi:hypothetical protein
MGATLFAALELSLSRWVVVASAPGADETGKHGLPACDGPGLVALPRRPQERAERRCGRPVAVAVMQEAGRDGFWVHRSLEAHGTRSTASVLAGEAFFRDFHNGAVGVAVAAQPAGQCPEHLVSRPGP